MNMEANPMGAAETVADAGSLIADRMSDEPSAEIEQEAPGKAESNAHIDEDESQGEPESEPEAGESKSETDEDEPKEVEVSAEETEDETAEATYETVEELAEALELSSDDFLTNIKAKVKIDGEVKELPLTEIVNGYQREADYRRKTMDLADTRKEFETQKESATKQIGEEYQRSRAVLNMLANQMKTEHDAVNWAELREYDSGEYAAKQEEFRQREGRLKSLWSDTEGHLQQTKQAQAQKQKEEFNTYLGQQQDLLLSALPTWSDSATAAAEQKEIGNYLIDNFGFSNADVFGEKGANGEFVSHGVTDHRLILLAKQAMKSSNVKTELAEKKVKRLPKVIKAGAKQGKKKLKQQKTDRVVAAAKSGSLESLGAAFADKL